jgi:hypothetical protein
MPIRLPPLLWFVIGTITAIIVITITTTITTIEESSLSTRVC